MLGSPTSACYVIEEASELPLHLRDRAPFKLPNCEPLFKMADDNVIGEDGIVRIGGAIEFQTHVSAGVLADVCDPDEIFRKEQMTTHRFRVVYDPEIQRGVKDDSSGSTSKEYLRPSQIKSMQDDLMEGKFECPQLLWNLRFPEVEWVFIRSARELHIFRGVATRPDTNHRHHAIVSTHRKYLQWVQDTGSAMMGNYNPQRQYKLGISTESFQDEANMFFVLNFKGWRVPTSTAFYIESKTDRAGTHTQLARRLLESSRLLSKNVELLNNQLSNNSAKMVTFGTLVEAIKNGFPSVTEDDFDGTLNYLVDFVEKLHRIRPNEIAVMSVAKRQKARTETVADQAVLWHGYVRLAHRLREQFGPSGIDKLDALGQSIVYSHPETLDEEVTSTTKTYRGDPFSRKNPAWTDNGVVAPGKTGPRVVNNRQSREGAYNYLCELLGIEARAARRYERDMETRLVLT